MSTAEGDSCVFNREAHTCLLESVVKILQAGYSLNTAVFENLNCLYCELNSTLKK